MTVFNQLLEQKRCFPFCPAKHQRNNFRRKAPRADFFGRYVLLSLAFAANTADGIIKLALVAGFALFIVFCCVCYIKYQDSSWQQDLVVKKRWWGPDIDVGKLRSLPFNSNIPSSWQGGLVHTGCFLGENFLPCFYSKIFFIFDLKYYKPSVRARHGGGNGRIGARRWRSRLVSDAL